MRRQKLRVAVYLRVSRDRYGVKKSVEEQAYEFEQDLRDHPEWTEFDRYEDNSLSASRFAEKDRPEFARMTGDVDGRRVDLVWMWEVSRQSRDLATFVPLRETCRRLGLKWYVHKERRLYDFANPADVSALTQAMVDAEQFSEETSERVNRSSGAAVRNGDPWGQVPYGYVRRFNQYNRRRESQELHPERAPVAVEIFRRVASGEAYTAIARDLNGRGVLAPTDAKRFDKLTPGDEFTPLYGWTQTTLKQTVANEAYLGRRTHYGKQHEAGEGATAGTARPTDKWPPLIDMDTFEQCRARRTRQSADGRWARASRPRRLLSGTMTCGVCGSTVHVRLRRGNTAYYVCRITGCISIPEPDADEVVIARLVAYLTGDEVAAILTPDTSAAVQEARDAYAAAVAEHEELLALGELSEHDGGLSAVAVARMEPSRLARIRETAAVVERLTVPGPVALVLRDSDGTDEGVRARFEALDMGQRRVVLDSLFVISATATGSGRRFRPDQIVMTPRRTNE
jgi:DNA invertase Pin-like site-specific DNA recombinase